MNLKAVNSKSLSCVVCQTASFSLPVFTALAVLRHSLQAVTRQAVQQVAAIGD